jgi:hypothetical protein
LKVAYVCGDQYRDYILDYRKWDFFTKVLIVCQSQWIHIRKKYPSMPLKELTKAVLNEDYLEFFEKPFVVFKVFQQKKTFTVVDVWITDERKLPDIKSYRYVVPEFGSFFSQENQITVYRDILDKSKIKIVAYGQEGFINGLICKEENLENEFSVFYRSIKSEGREFKRINLYDETLKNYFLSYGITVNTVRSDNPPFLDGKNLTKKEFKLKHSLKEFNLDYKPLFRVAFYVLGFYWIGLYLSVKNYEKAVNEINTKIDQIDQKIKSLDTTKESEDVSVYTQMFEYINSIPSVFNVLNDIGKALPEDSYIIKVKFSEKVLEATFNTKDPTNLLKTVAKVKSVKDVKILYPPSKTPDNNSYNITLSLELM